MCLCNFFVKVGGKIVRFESYAVFFHSYGKETKSKKDDEEEKEFA
ncbi:MAG: hypothetical protein Q8R17_02440 [bacterium]|nr:hypothetical protein [bacterium]